MIQINLLPGVKRKTAGSSKEAMLERAPRPGGPVKDPLLLVAVAAWVGAVPLAGIRVHPEQAEAQRPGADGWNRPGTSIAGSGPCWPRSGGPKGSGIRSWPRSP